MPKYLLQQRQGWYAVLEIPKALRGKLGKVRFKGTLHTDSLSLARQRVVPVIHGWKKLLKAVRSGDETLEASVMLWRSYIEEDRKLGMTDKELREQSIDVISGFDSKREAEEMAAAYLTHQVAFGDKFLLSEFLEDWNSSSTCSNKTKDMQMQAVKEFCSRYKFSTDATWHNVVAWVEDDLIQKQGLSAATARRKISACRSYWKWLMRHKGLADAPPFTDVVPARKKGATRPKRKGFDVADYRKLLDATSDGDTELANLIILGAHTGCRIEELCSLKLDKVKPDRFVIEDAKTQAGWREIPIHRDISQLVVGLASESSDGYLISGLTFNKYGDRSNAIGKRFGRLKLSLGYGPDHVFHSFRKGLARQLESNGVQENISARLLGHEITTMTYGLYSGGVDFSILVDAMSKVKWS